MWDVDLEFCDTFIYIYIIRSVFCIEKITYKHVINCALDLNCLFFCAVMYRLKSYCCDA